MELSVRPSNRLGEERGGVNIEKNNNYNTYVHNAYLLITVILAALIIIKLTNLQILYHILWK